jgi:hypothetical protein
MRRLAALFCITGFGGGLAFAEDIPLPRPRPPAPPAWIEPRTFREAAGPDFISADVTSAPSACRLRLEKVAVLAPMPRLIGPGACGGGDMVELDAVLIAGGQRVEIKPAPVLRCDMAERLAAWVREDAAPRVAKAGPALRSVDTYDDFDCRGRNRVRGARLSEHGRGNAVDVRSLTLADARVIRLTDKTVAKDLRSDLRASACARFTTVLGPGSDGYHEEHIHLDLADRHNGYRICQWDVLEPPPPPKPPEAKVAAEPKAPEGQPAPPVAVVEPDTPAAAAPPPVQFAQVVVPLPKPRPADAGKAHSNRRKTRGGIHFPFNLLR